MNLFCYMLLVGVHFFTLINEQGRLISEQERLIYEQEKLINEQVRLINEQERLINELEILMIFYNPSIIITTSDNELPRCVLLTCYPAFNLYKIDAKISHYPILKLIKSRTH